MKNDAFYVHFHPDEAGFVDKMTEWVARVVRNHEPKQTDFLDPRQMYILQTLVNRDPSAQLLSSGGHDDAERKRGLIAPDYAYLDAADVALEVISISSDDAKFPGLAHGDFLGSLLGLGLKREKIGDIYVHETFCHVVVAAEISEYIDLHLQQVHRVHVLTERLEIDKLVPLVPKMETLRLSVASMRLDGIVSDVVRMSRGKVLPPIKAGKCRVNWRVEENPATLLQTGDVVSLQGFGRFKVLEIEGESKSGRIRLTVGKYV